MLARLSAFVIWALVAATVAFWGLRLLVRAAPVPAYAVPVGDAPAAHGDLSRLLGSAPVAAVGATAAPQTSTRFRLLGIVAPKYPAAGAVPVQQGVALIAVDGNMPKAYRVGARLDDDLVLRSVSLRSVSIASSASGVAPITLELPAPMAAATGTLPANGTGGAPRPAMPAMPVPQYVPDPPEPAAPEGIPPAPPAITPTPPAPLVPAARPGRNAARQ
jgi:general secretion pathway protein C